LRRDSSAESAALAHISVVTLVGEEGEREESAVVRALTKMLSSVLVGKCRVERNGSRVDCSGCSVHVVFHYSGDFAHRHNSVFGKAIAVDELFDCFCASLQCVSTVAVANDLVVGGYLRLAGNNCIECGCCSLLEHVVYYLLR
jgi:hypothetical protein